MKFLLFLICLAGAVYYCFFHNPEIGDKITAKLGIASPGETEQPASPQPSAPVKSTELKFKENTLGARLTEMAKHDKFGIFFERQNAYCSYIPSKATDADLKKALEQNAETLQTARSLAEYNEFGLLAEETEWSSSTLLPYSGSFQTACAILTISGKIQAASGNAAVAEKDFALAAKIINVCLNGAHPSIVLLAVLRCHKELQTYILNSKLPKAAKQRLLKRMPDRKVYAIAIQQSLDIQKEVLLNSCNAVQQGNKTARDLGITDADFQTLKKLPAKIEEYWPQGAEHIVTLFANGILSRETTFNTGSAKINQFIKQFMLPMLYGQISESLDGFKGKK